MPRSDEVIQGDQPFVMVIVAGVEQTDLDQDRLTRTPVGHAREEKAGTMPLRHRAANPAVLERLNSRRRRRQGP